MAELFTLDASFLARKRAQLAAEIISARFRLKEDEPENDEEEEEPTWYTAQITAINTLTNGKVEVNVVFDISEGDIVEEIELYDIYGGRIGGRDVSLEASEDSEGISYVLDFYLFQAQENTDGTGSYDEL